jgi:hypothetical protein
MSLPNLAVGQPAGSHAFAAAAYRGRSSLGTEGRRRPHASQRLVPRRVRPTLLDAPGHKEQLFPKDLPPHLQRLYAQDRAALVITPTPITSWDLAKVRH